MRSQKRWAVLPLALIFLTAAAWSQSGTSTPNPAGVSQTVHNLSVTGPGTIKAGVDSGVCIFCHTPHNDAQSQSSLWNKTVPSDVYTTYSNAVSSTYNQPTTPLSTRSKLCLSCHDGTVALGQTVATGDLGLDVTMSQTKSTATMGMNLSADHPVSIPVPVQDDGEISDWLHTTGGVSPDPTVKIYSGQVECITCHDPHTQDNDSLNANFLVRSNSQGAICTTCHDGTRGDLAGYQQSQHFLAQNAVSAPGMPYGSVGANACSTCHTSHEGANGGARLLRGVEENTCFTCHSSTSAASPTPNPAPDVQTIASGKTYKHPIISVSGVHDTGEQLPVNSPRHSECEDCHNPHVAQKPSSTVGNVAPAVQSELMGSKGVGVGGNVIAPAQYGYEVCFKCHAGSTNKPQKFGYDQPFGRTPLRQSHLSITPVDQYNTAKEFQSTIARHNVTQTLSGYPVPSLRTVMTNVKGADTTRSPQTGQLYCSDCHNNDDARNDGGATASGPHGSNWEHLMERQYAMNVPNADGTTTKIPYVSGPSGTYAMCDKCHDLDGKLFSTADTVFGLHRQHVVDGGVSCASCHNSHGVQNNNGGGHNGLVDIDTALARKLDGTAITAADTVVNTQTRTCSLVCHGHTHNGDTYPQP